jgi:hypothetical protein
MERILREGWEMKNLLKESSRKLYYGCFLTIRWD